MSWFIAYIVLAWCIRVAMLSVVLRRQLAPGASLAWLGIVFLHPYIGTSLYLLVGETRMGPRRVERHREIVRHYRSALPGHGPEGARREAARDAAGPERELPSSYAAVAVQARKMSGLPALGGNAVELVQSTEDLVRRLTEDIDAARSEVHLLYYLFAPDATGVQVARAVTDAARRGVRCRVLADAVASRRFFRRSGLRRRLAAAGVEVAAAMPVAPISRGLPRMDLRNHRKLAVIDGRVAYAGSHNLIDANYGGRRGAPWVDLSGRFTGPVVGQIGSVFAEDWAFETGTMLDPPATVADAPPAERTLMQVVPTGPSLSGATYRRLLLAAVQSARRRLLLTTPYFVPDEPTLVALVMAVDRGVDVTLVLPRVADHGFTAAAGRAHFARLLEAGVSIFLYQPGLLHAKSTTVDDAFALLGSANLDVRSFNLNFELSVLMYGPEVTGRVRAVQSTYLADSQRLCAESWGRRSFVRRYADSAVSLLSPLL